MLLTFSRGLKIFLRRMKTGIFRPGKNGKCIKLKFETFGEGNSDHLLSVDVKILIKFEVNIIQNGP